jgi:hypothetical protein
MRSDPEREQLFDEALARIAELPPTEGLEVLLQIFLSVLNGMDVQSACRMRDELANRFGGRHCSGQVCRMMAELANGYLMMSPARADQSGA